MNFRNNGVRKRKAQKTNCNQFIKLKNNNNNKRVFKNVFPGRHTCVIKSVIQGMVNTKSRMVFTSGLGNWDRERTFGKGTPVLSRIFGML